jgi:hypothetical protein
MAAGSNRFRFGGKGIEHAVPEQQPTTEQGRSSITTSVIYCKYINQLNTKKNNTFEMKKLI